MRYYLAYTFSKTKIYLLDAGSDSDFINLM